MDAIMDREMKKSLRCRLRLCQTKVIHNGLVSGDEKRSERTPIVWGQVHECSDCGRVIFKLDEKRTRQLAI